MVQNATKKQWVKFFINELVSFTALFAILGGIIYLSFKDSIDKNINSRLYGQKNRDSAKSAEIVNRWG